MGCALSFFEVTKDGCCVARSLSFESVLAAQRLLGGEVCLCMEYTDVARYPAAYAAVDFACSVRTVIAR